MAGRFWKRGRHLSAEPSRHLSKRKVSLPSLHSLNRVDFERWTGPEKPGRAPGKFAEKCPLHETGEPRGMFHCTLGAETAFVNKLHVEQTESWQAVFLQQSPVDILPLQLRDLCAGHFTPVGGQITIGLCAHGHNLSLRSRRQQDRE